MTVDKYPCMRAKSWEKLSVTVVKVTIFNDNVLSDPPPEDLVTN